MERVADWLDAVMGSKGECATTARVREEIREFCAKFPLPH